MTVQQWVDEYADAWRERDAEEAAALFREDSSYRSHPLQEAHLGSEGVRSYWETVTAAQYAVDVRMGTLSKALGGLGAYICASRPVVDLVLNRARPLVFSTALPAALRETYFFEPGDHAPHAGWGA